MDEPGLTQLRRNRDFTLLQLGQGLSPAKAGLVGFARLIPYPLFVLGAGVVVDRFDRRRVMIVSDVIRAIAVGSIVVGLALDSLSLAQIAVVAFVEGTAFA